MRTLALLMFFSVFGTQSVLAHGGHVGDLAGHSHWVGWAAAAAAGAIAAWAIKRRNKNKATGQDKSAEADSGQQPESAEA
jgi:membrane protein implicated in regulation of membrane protease activity